MNKLGITFKTYQVPTLHENTKEYILWALGDIIGDIKAENDFESVDLIRVKPNAPNTSEMRDRFRKEHIHVEDEARFFVEGRGAFYINLNDVVLMLVCEAGDYVSVPADTKHWFDMSVQPDFTAIRFFSNHNGWIAEFTGNEIAACLPEFCPWSAPY
jgi:1,2-dihydroxy-3-keto-5-methylthiopentene dioxygenase